MPKNRNAFFNENPMYPPGYDMNAPMMHHGMPHPGIHPPHHPGMPEHGMVANIEARIAKMERQLIRLETRVNKLENTTTTPTPVYSDDDITVNNNSTSMYIV